MAYRIQQLVIALSLCVVIYLPRSGTAVEPGSALPPTIIETLELASEGGGIAALLGRLRSIVSEDGQFSLTEQSARDLAHLCSRLAARLPDVDTAYFGAIGATVSAALPDGTGVTAVAAVATAIIENAPPEERTAIRAGVLADIALATGMDAEHLAQEVSVGAADEVGVITAVRSREGTGAERPMTREKLARPKEPSALTGPGVRVKSFLLFPELIVSEFYDDNLFAATSNEVDDFATIVSPSVTLESDWVKHFLRLDAGGDIARYESHERENSEDYRVTGNGRFDISPAAYAFGGAAFREEHEDRESPDDVNGTEPTDFQNVDAYGGIYRRFGRLAVRVGGTYDRLDFDDTPSTFGPINNDDRDREHVTAGGRLTYRVSSRYQVFMQGSYDAREYRQNLDDNLFDRESDGYRLSAGVAASIPGVVRAEAFVGGLDQNYDDPALPDINVVDFGAFIDWQTGPFTSVTVYVDRTVEETTIFGASGALDTVAGLEVVREFGSKALLDLSFFYSHAEFRGIGRDDETIGIDLGLRYAVTPHFILEADYGYRELNSERLNEDYTRNLVFLRGGFLL